MKKVILAFEGTAFSEGAYEFARGLQKIQPILLVGVFLPQTSLVNLWSYAEGRRGTIPLIESYESEMVNESIKRFEHLCEKDGIEFRVHKDFYDLALPELEKESEFADLLVLGSETFYESLGIDSPNIYLRDTLHGVKCPVVIVPEKFDFPESIILAYDGSADSLYAIKQFAYLFPELCDKKTILVYAGADASEDFPEKVQIEELTARHFSNLTLLKLNVDPKKYFNSWLLEKKSAMLVSGAYGRSDFSQMLKKSFVTDVIADHRLPVFIAHH